MVEVDADIFDDPELLARFEAEIQARLGAGAAKQREFAGHAVERLERLVAQARLIDDVELEQELCSRLERLTARRRELDDLAARLTAPASPRGDTEPRSDAAATGSFFGAEEEEAPPAAEAEPQATASLDAVEPASPPVQFAGAGRGEAAVAGPPPAPAAEAEPAAAARVDAPVATSPGLLLPSGVPEALLAAIAGEEAVIEAEWEESEEDEAEALRLLAEDAPPAAPQPDTGREESRPRVPSWDPFFPSSPPAGAPVVAGAAAVGAAPAPPRDPMSMTMSLPRAPGPEASPSRPAFQWDLPTGQVRPPNAFDIPAGPAAPDPTTSTFSGQEEPAANAETLQLEIAVGNRHFAWSQRGGAWVVGRRDPLNNFMPDVDLWPDGAVSRRHARILSRAGRYYLVDLRSTNGTELNDRPLQPNVEMLLQPGDRILLGERTRIYVRAA